jgi:manganese transport protein
MVPVPGGSWCRKALAFAGPGYLVAVGYMDPGNWATGLAGGASFGYALLPVIVLSNLMAMFLQSLAIKLGVVTRHDLAQACRARYTRPTRLFLWLWCEAAIVACDLAELIGTAIGLQLLFGIPLLLGVALTTLQVLLVLWFQQRGFRRLEAFIVALMLVIAACFATELVLARPDLGALGASLVPSREILTDRDMLYLAIGILGATVMPHNLYLHSAIVQTRRIGRTPAALREALRFATLDIVVALGLAILINAAILILAAATFHGHVGDQIVGIEEAYRLLAPALGAGAASTLFAVALLAAGMNSSITATMAGQIVMEGFTDFRWPSWLRRLVARMLAMVPTLAVILLFGEEGAARLLILSQVVLSLQLPFAVYPLVRLTNSRRWMGEFVNRPATAALAWLLTGALCFANLYLLVLLL